MSTPNYAGDTIDYDIQISGVQRAVYQLKTLEVSIEHVMVAVYGALGLLRRLTGNEQVEEAITKIMRLIATIRMLQTAILALEVSSGPVGVGLAAIGVLGTGLTMSEELTDGIRSVQA